MTNEEYIEQIKIDGFSSPMMLDLFNNNIGIIHAIILPFTKMFEYEDLKQESFIALCDAISCFDKDKGLFATYFPYWIKSRLNLYRRNNMAAHIPQNKRDLIRKYNNLVLNFEQELGRLPSDKESSVLLGVSLNTINRIKQAKESMRIVSLDKPIELDEGSIPMSETIADESRPYDEIERRYDNELLNNALNDALEHIPPDESVAIKRHYFENRTLQDIAKEKNISYQLARVRINNGLSKLRKGKHSKLLKEFLEEQTARVYKGGFSTYSNKGTSITEDIAIKLYEKEISELNRYGIV